MRRVLAVLGAVAMVAAAVVIRRGLDDDGGTDDRANDKIVMVCAADLEAYCAAYGDDVEVRLASAAETAEALRDGTLPDDVDGWVTSSAWLELLGDDAAALGEPERIATSPISVAALSDRTDALEEVCGTDLIWDCLLRTADAAWSDLGVDLPGRVAVGFPSADTATGLPVLASTAAGAFGSLDFASNDFDAEFRAELATLVSASGGTDGDPVRTMVTQRGKYSAAGAPDARVADLSNDAVVLVDTAPVVDATIVVVPLRGADRPPSAAPVREALDAEGWTAASGSDVAPTLKDGVMSALHEVWLEAI
jgi:hypothetical protein